MSHPEISFGPIRTLDAIAAIKDSIRHQTWSPQSIGIFGLERRALLRRETFGHLTLPMLRIFQPSDIPESTFQRADQFKYSVINLMFANLVAHEFTDQKSVAAYELGIASYIVTGELLHIPTSTKPELYDFELVDDAVVLDRLRENYDEFRRPATWRAIAAIEAYVGSIQDEI